MNDLNWSNADTGHIPVPGTPPLAAPARTRQ